MLINDDKVTNIQFLGFSIALGGLAYYQLGGAPAVRGLCSQAINRFSEYRRPSEADPVSAIEAQEVVMMRKSEEELKSPGIVNVKSA